MRRLLLGVTLLTCASAPLGRAHAQDAPEVQVPAAGAVEVPGQAFGPRYVVSKVEVRGNARTRPQVIENEMLLHAGDVITADDPRVEASRFRVLGLGFFEEVRLSLARGSTRGHVVLVVDVVERGTFILNDVFLGVSSATSWAGLDMGENNFLGHGVSVSGAFVLSTRADAVPGSVFQQAYRLRLWDPSVHGSRVAFGGEVLYTRGGEFYRASGPASEDQPADFVAMPYRRVGGMLSGGFDAGRYAQVRVSHRAEVLDATLPDDRTRTLPNGELTPIEFNMRPGRSYLSVLGTAVEIDTRSDPVLPQSGFRLLLDAQIATRLWGSDYNYMRLSAGFDHYTALPWHHVVALRVNGGVVVGDAPFFETFYIGDLDRLLPPRALGLDFSVKPAPNLLGFDAIADRRYGTIAGRITGEYIVPLWRNHHFIYAGDLFAQMGVFTLTDFAALEARDTSIGGALPFDLTLDVGVRLDTYIGIFTLSIANAIGRLPL
jgi:outer membrane protein assembly factor BamA